VKTRTPLAILAATAIAGLGLTALATPASANTTVTISYDADSEQTNVSPDNASGTSVTVSNTRGAAYWLKSTSLIGNDENSCNWTGYNCEISGENTATFEIVQDVAGAVVQITDTDGESTTVASFEVTYSDGSSPAPAAPAAAPAPAPATVNVTLDQITSKVLRAWASTATLGSWQQLPESSDITGVDENAGKTFLGAATTPNFPVDIAQRQVDNGWGPYETFNEDGDLTSVFIPAGKPMNINGPTRLYAIWGN